MNESEKYLFDLKGYIVVKGALTSAQVDDLSARLERKRAECDRFIYGSDRTVFREADDPAWSAPSLLEWGGTYLDLIDVPSVAPYLEALMGKHYRLDHDYIGINNSEHTHKLYLHGGGQGAGGPKDLVGPSDGGQCYYHYNNGKFYNGLVAVAFGLDDVAPGSGGFACVPGSHKANYPLPDHWRVSALQEDMPGCVEAVATEAGDAIIFTEALAHGTVPWQGNGERRTIFYKYCPHAVAWAPCYYNADHYGDLSEQQRAMLLPPSAYGDHEATEPIWRKAREEQTELVRLRAELAALKESAEQT